MLLAISTPRGDSVAVQAEPLFQKSANPTPNRQKFCNGLLAELRAFFVPSVVSKHSFNLVFLAGAFTDYSLVAQERVTLDQRLVTPK